LVRLFASASYSPRYLCQARPLAHNNSPNVSETLADSHVESDAIASILCAAGLQLQEREISNLNYAHPSYGSPYWRLLRSAENLRKRKTLVLQV